jgi:cellulose synthase/poly-beta-1,6-N-acetylglucosamine synthase-like glycosyltransferase
MKIAFWLSLAMISYTYAGYPLVICLMARWRPRPWRNAPVEKTVSVVMAVHNGAHLLRGQIEHLASLDPRFVREVIIVSDGSSDGTAEILSEINGARFKTIALEEQSGKASALNHGIAVASGEIVLFVDIRPKIGESAVAQLLSNFADPSVGCVGGELVLQSEGHEAVASAVSGVYWRYEQWIRNCEAAWDSPVGVYGGFYAARRELLTEYPAGIILDDMFQPLAILRQGYRSVLDRTALVMDTWPKKVTGEFQRKVRTLAGNYQLVSLAPWVLSWRNRVLFQLVSHKLLRLVVPYLFILLLVSATLLGLDSRGWSVLALMQWGFWLIATIGLWVRIPVLHKIATPAGALLVLNAAAVAGLYKFCFTSGPLWKIWSPPSRKTESPMHLEAKGGRA